RGHVRRVPPAVDVGLREPLAAFAQGRPDARVAHDHGRLRRTGAEDPAVSVLDEGELSGLDALEQSAREAAGDGLELHEASGRGCGKYGAPLTLRAMACA